MQCDCHVRPGEALEQAGVNHASGAGDGFFGRLADQNQRAVPCLFAVDHDRSRAGQRCHMQIVSAGVHNRNVPSNVILGMDLASIVQARFFFDRKRVQLCTEHDGWPRAIPQHSHDPGTANVFSDVIAETA